MQAVQSLPAHITVEGLPKAVMSTFLKTTPGTLKEMSTSEINLNSVDHKLVRALMPFQQEGVRSVFLKMILLTTYFSLLLPALICMRLKNK